MPAGNPDGGQWTRVAQMGGAGAGDPQILSDATPDNFFEPGTQFAQDDQQTVRLVDLH
ncbi:MAG: hypothetical protein HY659_14770 [Rhizobiales bacterium]|nr:hypothetical protein [Hyphomicrobiales bacterium]